MVKILISILLIVWGLQAQPIEEWTVSYPNGGSKEIGIDELGNLYVTGWDGVENSDIVTIFYTPFGHQRWIQRYDGPVQGDDRPGQMAVGKQGNVYITGGSEGEGTSYDYVTIKYNWLGAQQWVARYDYNHLADISAGIAIDDAENVYITGTVQTSGTEALLPDTIFVPSEMEQEPRDIVTIKYNSNGTEIWRTRWDIFMEDQATGIAVDGDGNTYVTGYTSDFSWDFFIFTLKYDNLGRVEWVRTQPSMGGTIKYHRIAVDLEGNVYVAGMDDNWNYVTISYDPSGALRWSKTYHGSGNDWNEPTDIAIDKSGNVYVTGYSPGSETEKDYATIKYDKDGNELWVNRYDYEQRVDHPEALTIDNLGNIYVTGSSHPRWIPDDYKWITIKYKPDGTCPWVAFSDNSIANDIVTDPVGNVYVTGVGSNSGFYTIKYGVSNSPLATFPNQGRHLVRAPNMEDLDWIYEGHDERLIWQWKGDLLLGPPTYIGETGKYPTIAQKEPDAPWVAYTTGNSLFGLLKEQGTPNTWVKKLIKSGGGNILPPSLVLSATEASPQAGDLGYVVYTTLNPTADNCIRFSAFDADRVYYETVLDYGEDISSPSIAITPGDYLHVVWRKENSIYYITTLEPVDPSAIRQGTQPVWSVIDRVSTEPPQWLTEPASNPFVEAQGEWVYVVWRGPNQEGNSDYGEIWQRNRRMDWPVGQWTTPVNISQTLNEESNYPTMSTGYSVVWQESIPENPNNPANYETYAYLLTEPGWQKVNISNTPTNSFYPHTNLMPTYDPNEPEDWRLFSIWTEETIPQTFYRVKFYDYYFSGPDTNIWPLSIPGGDSTPSPYCLERDGFIQFNGMNIDYDSTSLAYIIPYMNPRKHYLLEAIAYHESSGVYRQSFTFKNRSFVVRLRRAIPETLRVIIPPGLYDSTFINLRINRVQGSFAALAKLRLYEFEIIKEKEGGSQSLETTEIPLKTSLFSPFPNPFTNDLSIKYQLSKPDMVLLKVFNISGREVKTLANESKEPGTYTVNFDGKDAHSLRLPLGIYFIQLKTKDLSISKKVILTR